MAAGTSEKSLRCPGICRRPQRVCECGRERLMLRTVELRFESSADLDDTERHAIPSHQIVVATTRRLSTRRGSPRVFAVAVLVTMTSVSQRLVVAARLRKRECGRMTRRLALARGLEGETMRAYDAQFRARFGHPSPDPGYRTHQLSYVQLSMRIRRWASTLR